MSGQYAPAGGPGRERLAQPNPLAGSGRRNHGQVIRAGREKISMELGLWPIALRLWPVALRLWIAIRPAHQTNHGFEIEH